jgi:membrane protein DedA with SNARE-associated domain
LGGEYLWDIPHWASVVFSPGFLVGFKVNEWGLDKDVSKVVGVLAVGLAYAAVAALARLVWSATKRRRHLASLRKSSK